VTVYSDPKSPWGRRVWIPDTEFDRVMDSVRAQAPGCFRPGRGVDVDEILARVYKVEPDFGDPDDACLGRTCFEADGSFKVMINRALAEEADRWPVARRRLRSTLAHELAHIAFHAVLHPSHQGPGLFEDIVEPTKVMCRMDAIDGADAYPPWWEYQANRGMASLLLPRDLVREQLSAALDRRGLGDIHSALAAEQGKVVLDELAGVFDVSFEMTVFRLLELGFLPKNDGQGNLTV
jgi:hypothetical protein